MAICTVVIPVAAYHQEVAARAIDSALAQTVPCDVLVMVDDEGRGAGWARNQAAMRADTEFIVFLDADDEIASEFVEKTLEAYTPGVFVYTDWVDGGGRLHTLPDCTADGGWVAGETFHLVTTLLPTALWREVGGFDESLPMEDTDFYVRLAQLGVCGVRCPLPLVTYNHQQGRRALAGEADPRRDELMRRFEQGMRSAPMCKCREQTRTMQASSLQDGDVLVEALYAPRTEIGKVTGRFYPRVGFGESLWVNRRDAVVGIEQGLWRLAHDPVREAPGRFNRRDAEKI